VAELTKKERAGLPDRAFAYVDSQGHRRLPIHDEAHVRNALARFDRVAFEDDAAEERPAERREEVQDRPGGVRDRLGAQVEVPFEGRRRVADGIRHLPGNRGRECLSSVVWAYRHLRR
jgi:hypothetical protein